MVAMHHFLWLALDTVVEVVMNVYVTFSVVDIFCMVFPHSKCIEWFYFDYSSDGNGQSKTDKMYECVLYVTDL